MRAWLVDTFAEDGFLGNPAAVVPRTGDFPPVAVMQDVARELDLPTTAFVVPAGDGGYQIRWFTPQKEINLCGHATIATAGYLYDVEGVDSAAPLRFQTGTGPLYTVREDGHISIDMPRVEVAVGPPPPGLARTLGAPIVRCGVSSDDLLVELESVAAVADLRPDFAALATLPFRGHIATAAATDAGTDFVSRTFFPALGVDEDQVCVSAHCKLGPYWAERLGRRRMAGQQLSQRGGRLLVDVLDDRVRVLGSARVRAEQRLVPDAIQV